MSGSQQATPQKAPPRIGRWIRSAGTVLALTLLVFLILEGLSSTVAFVLDFAAPTRANAGEWQYTQHDEELGWVNRPNVTLPDFFGPGRDYHTNSRGFRSTTELETAEASGGVRVVCSGDSFTQGSGVSDDDTWCAQIAALDARVEAVNLGQAAYGVGQMYLRYTREAPTLPHDVHLFLLITADIVRLERDDFLGARKPRLELEDGSLTARNVPIPEPGFLPLSEGRVNAIRRLSLVRLANAALRAFAPPDTIPSAQTGEDYQLRPETHEVFDAIIDDLVRRASENGASLFVVYLPTLSEHRLGESPDGRGSPAREWRGRLAANAAVRGFSFVDMHETFDEISPTEIQAMYLSDAVQGLRLGHGHLSELGNLRVAEVLYQRLVEHEVLGPREETTR